MIELIVAEFIFILVFVASVIAINEIIPPWLLALWMILGWIAW